MVEAARQGRGVLRYARPARRALRGVRLPVIRPLVGVLYAFAQIGSITWQFLAKLLYREPVFRYRCQRVGQRLNLEGAPPLIIGSGRIEVGDDVHVGSPCTWDVGPDAELLIGDRVSLNYRGVISVRRRVQIGDDTLIAGEVAIFDNTNHPVSPALPAGQGRSRGRRDRRRGHRAQRLDRPPLHDHAGGVDRRQRGGRGRRRRDEVRACEHDRGRQSRRGHQDPLGYVTSLIARALREPRVASREGRAILKGLWCRIWCRLRGIRFTAGRNLRIDGRLSLRGPGAVILGDNVRMGMTVTPWTYTADAVITIGDNFVRQRDQLRLLS